MFFIIPIIITVLCVGVFVFVFVKGVSQWNKNNNSPRLSVFATAVAKRTSVSHTMHTTGNNTFSTPSTDYYITFQVESGDRMEFRVNGSEYGMICEGDVGKLTFQGTRYLGFERDHSM